MNDCFFQIVDAIISHGCFLQECSVQHSIVGVRSRLDNDVELEVCFYVFLAIVRSVNVVAKINRLPIIEALDFYSYLCILLR